MLIRKEEESMRIFLFFFLFSLQELLAGENTSLKAEPIARKSRDYYFRLTDPGLRKRELYSWEKEGTGSLCKISKEFFRCKGSLKNPEKLSTDKTHSFSDCEGGNKHPLSQVHGKEGIYPILIDLLNYVQMKTQKRVQITCGHRCSRHNSYADPSKENLSSKHQLGAEVDFYVIGMEHEPEKVIALLQEFYLQDASVKKEKEFTRFERFEKKGLNVSTLPWYNKEIFIKLYKKHEGRDVDNQHAYPYIGIQVRYDRLLKERVTFH
jgi:hypothetical protein